MHAQQQGKFQEATDEVRTLLAMVRDEKNQVPPTPYNLLPSPYSLHPTPNTFLPAPFTLHPNPYALNPASNTLHLKP